MAKVDIHLEPGETIEEAEEQLLKAMQHQVGHEHKDAFHQPSARDVFNKLIKEHEKTLERTMKEIMGEIDSHVFD